MCNFVPRLEHEFGFLSFFEKCWTLIDLEEITYLAIELLVHSSPKIKATFVSFSQTRLLVHFYFFAQIFTFRHVFSKNPNRFGWKWCWPNSFVLLTYLYGWKITENFKSFCKTGKLVPFFSWHSFLGKQDFDFFFFNALFLVFIT